MPHAHPSYNLYISQISIAHKLLGDTQSYLPYPTLKN